MPVHVLLITIFCLAGFCRAQVTIIGHNMINHVPLQNTLIEVKKEGAVVQSIDTRNKSDFRVQLDFGSNYQIIFTNNRSPRMFMEVMAAGVPAEKFEYRMTYELNIPFVDRKDEDIDTLVFSRAFHRVVYNGKSKMVDDTAYNNEFARNLLKAGEHVPVQSPDQNMLPAIVAGKIMLEAKNAFALGNRVVLLLDRNGNELRRTVTSRSGEFVFSKIRINEASAIKMLISEAESGGKPINLLNSNKEIVATQKAAEGSCRWELNDVQFFSLVDNSYSNNVGGKLVASSAKQKKFYADKTVYLSNRLNTVVQQTRSSELGTFVFEGLKPDQDYLIGVETAELQPGERIDLLSRDDHYLGTLDSLTGNKSSLALHTSHNPLFDGLSLAENEIKMGVKGTIYGDNVNNPIGKLKIILLNDHYEVIDSALTSDLGAFRFKYLPFLKRFYLSAENNNNILDVFKNILIYSSDDNLIKIMTHEKGRKFRYQPLATELSRLREIELDDPWLDLVDPDPAMLFASSGTTKPPALPKKPIAENIHFETGRYNITDASKEILDKIILVLHANKKLRIEIGAHTDSKGTARANLLLSEQRAASVKQYLTAGGIDASRIETKGYGESFPLNNCGEGSDCTEMEHAQNRRTEFRILDTQ